MRLVARPGTVHVLVHGGAGGVPDDPDPRQAILDDAAETAATADTPLDAVEAAVGRLEHHTRFNAGLGGAIQSDGVARTDAGVMTSDRRIGAVAGLTGVRDVVTVARGVLEETPHVLVAGERAGRFAETLGIETGLDTTTTDTRARWADEDAPAAEDLDAQRRWVRRRFGSTTADPSTDAVDGRADADGSPPADTDHDTVGAVACARDDTGADGPAADSPRVRFAAATSTGGRWAALAGRVGDVPQVGAGFYCSPAGAASATGAGEDIARVTLARRAVRALEEGRPAQAAAERAIDEFADLTGSDAGVIVVGPDGGGSAFDAAGMQTSTARQ
jgi:beta-aspartyl-peptidase (threonine type)